MPNNQPPRPSVIVRNPNSAQHPASNRNHGIPYILNINDLKKPMVVHHMGGNVDEETYTYEFTRRLSSYHLAMLNSWSEFTIPITATNPELFNLNTLLIKDFLKDTTNEQKIKPIYTLTIRDNVVISVTFTNVINNKAYIEYLISNPRNFINSIPVSKYGIHISYQTILYIKNNFPNVHFINTYAASPPASQIYLDLGFTAK